MHWERTHTPQPEDLAALRQHLRSFNDAHSPHHLLKRSQGALPLAIFLRDTAKNLVGGISAETLWGWLTIDLLWVSETLRAQGYGRILLETLEEEARARGCRFVQLRTWDFQAKDFYEYMGYTVIGALEDYPPGQTFFWMRKTL